MNSLGVTSDRVLPRKVENLVAIAETADPVDREMLAVFDEEIGAEIVQIEQVLLKWDRENSVDPIKRIRLSFHTIKGAANSIGHVRIGGLADGMEEMLVKFNPAYAFVLRDAVIKTCILVIAATKELIKEAHHPRFCSIKKETLLAAVDAIVTLKERGSELQGAA